MIEQYLSNTNEIATVLILPKILELNKAQHYRAVEDSNLGIGGVSRTPWVDRRRSSQNRVCECVWRGGRWGWPAGVAPASLPVLCASGVHGATHLHSRARARLHLHPWTGRVRALVHVRELLASIDVHVHATAS